MADYALNPAFADLPVELLRIIISHYMEPGCDDAYFEGLISSIKWLAVPKTTAGWQPAVAERLRCLRALSQICRRLRAVVLPLMWRAIHVDTIAELGRVQRCLRAMPGLASHVRTFVFAWQLPDLVTCAATFNGFEEPFTKFELAFHDRSKIYARLLAQSGCAERRRARELTGGLFEGRAYYAQDGVRHYDPGTAPLRAGCDPSKDESYDWEARRLGLNGADGAGKDELIKDTKDFQAAVVEIFTQLTKLEYFAWRTDFASIPKAAFQALSKLTTLRFLDMTLTTFQSRDEVEHPLWELCHSLEFLSLNMGTRDPLHDTGQMNEEVIASYELPTALPANQEEFDAQRCAIAARAIVTAARGGLLKYLTCSDNIEAPFAVRALLPFWVQAHLRVEQRELQEWDDASQWLIAANQLRPVLLHAFYYFKSHKHLDCNDIQSLRHWVQQERLPKDFGPLRGRQPVERYLEWLRDDAELAQQVLTAWDALVENEEVAFIECVCVRCLGEGEETESSDTEEDDDEAEQQ